MLERGLDVLDRHLDGVREVRQYVQKAYRPDWNRGEVVLRCIQPVGMLCKSVGMRNRLVQDSFLPHPCPLPLGEGETQAVVG